MKAANHNNSLNKKRKSHRLSQINFFKMTNTVGNTELEPFSDNKEYEDEDDENDEDFTLIEEMDEENIRPNRPKIYEESSEEESYEKTDESCSNMEDDEDEDGSTLTKAASNIADSIIKM